MAIRSGVSVSLRGPQKPSTTPFKEHARGAWSIPVRDHGYGNWSVLGLCGGCGSYSSENWTHLNQMRENSEPFRRNSRLFLHSDHTMDSIRDEIVTCMGGYVSLCGDSNSYQLVTMSPAERNIPTKCLQSVGEELDYARPQRWQKLETHNTTRTNDL